MTITKCSDSFLFTCGTSTERANENGGPSSDGPPFSRRHAAQAMNSFFTSRRSSLPISLYGRASSMATRSGQRDERRRFLISVFNSSRPEEHTSELQLLMSTPYAVFCLKNTIPKLHLN